MKQGNAKQLKPLRKAILQSLTGIVLVICLILSGWNLVTQYNSVNQQTESTLSYSALENSAKISQWLQGFSGILDSLAQETGFKELYQSRDEMESYLGARLQNKTNILSVYMSTTANLMIDSTNWRPDASFIADEREWYSKAKDTDAVVYTEPYVDAQTGQMVMTISKRVMHNGQFQGVMAMDIVTDVIKGYIQQSVKDDGSYAFLVDGQGSILVHPDEAYAPKDETYFSLKDMEDGAYAPLANVIDRNEQGAVVKVDSKTHGSFYYTFTQVPETGWCVASAYPASYAQSAIFFAILSMVATFFLCMVLIGYGILRFSRRYLSPIGQVTDLMNEVTAGNLQVKTEGIAKNSMEIAALVNAAQQMTRQNADYVREIGEVLGQMAKGDFDVETQCDYVGDYTAIRTALEGIANRLGGMLSEIQSSFALIRSDSDILQQSANRLTLGISRQTQSQEELSNSIELIAGQVRMNAQNADQVNELSVQTKQEIGACSGRMHEMSVAMKRISEFSEQIGKIVKTIDDIAFQTNILALNAAVEAARAGAAGKGFAVVADEVRSLAARSGEAAKSTTQLIDSTIQAVSEGARLAKMTEEALSVVVQSSENTLGKAQQIAEATGQQAKQLDEITVNVTMLDETAVENNASASQSAEASSRLDSQIQTLDRQVSAFRLKPSATREGSGSATEEDFSLSGTKYW